MTICEYLWLLLFTVDHKLSGMDKKRRRGRGRRGRGRRGRGRRGRGRRGRGRRGRKDYSFLRRTTNPASARSAIRDRIEAQSGTGYQGVLWQELARSLLALVQGLVAVMFPHIH